MHLLRRRVSELSLMALRGFGRFWWDCSSSARVAHRDRRRRRDGARRSRRADHRVPDGGVIDLTASLQASVRVRRRRATGRRSRGLMGLHGVHVTKPRVAHL